MFNRKLQASLHPVNSEKFLAFYSGIGSAPASYSVREIGTIIGVHESTVRRYIDRGFITTFKNVKGHLRVSPEAIKDYIENCTYPAWRRANNLWW